MSIEIIISLGIYFIAMLLIGWYAFKKTTDINDYMLGGDSDHSLLLCLPVRQI